MTQRLKPATGPGSINCENEIRALIHANNPDAAMALYEADARVHYVAGHNHGNQRLKYWYQMQKLGLI